MFEAANSTGSKQIFTLNNKYHLWKFLSCVSWDLNLKLGNGLLLLWVSWERFCGRNQLKEHFQRKGGEDLEYEFKDQGKISRAANGEIDREMAPLGERTFAVGTREMGKTLCIQTRSSVTEQQ